MVISDQIQRDACFRRAAGHKSDRWKTIVEEVEDLDETRERHLYCDDCDREVPFTVEGECVIPWES